MLTQKESGLMLSMKFYVLFDTTLIHLSPEESDTAVVQWIGILQ